MDQLSEHAGKAITDEYELLFRAVGSRKGYVLSNLVADVCGLSTSERVRAGVWHPSA